MAADGQGGVFWDVGLAEGFPYLPDMRGKRALRVMAQGHCDPSMGDVKERLTPFRETMLAFRGTIAAANSPIVIASGQELAAFSVGVGDDGATIGLTGALTRAETNTQPKGGLVQQGQSFVAVGAWVQPVEPWTVATGASLLGSVDAAAPRNYRAFLRSPVSPYNKVLLQAVSEAASFQLRNGPATACQFDMSPFSLWGQSAGMSSARNGATIPGAFFYTSTPDVSGGTQSGKELNAQIKLERTLTIESDAANQTAACDVAIPWRIVFVGYPVCNVAPDAMSAADLQQMMNDVANKAVQSYIAQTGGGGTNVDVNITKQSGRFGR